MLHYPGFDPVALALGPIKLRWYGIMYVIGFLSAWGLARHRAAKPDSTWTPLDVDDVLFFAVFGVILGGRIGWLLFYGQQALQEDPSYWYKIWLGGMSFHGGLIGVLVALWFFAWRRGRRLVDVFDFAAPLPAIGIGAGRIGNFINGELWGKPTDVPWAFQVTREDGVVQALHASQLYEAALEGLLLFAILWWFTSRPRPRWAPSGLFLACYGLFRILVELVRVPDAQLGYLAGSWLTMGMILSSPMLLAGIAMLAYAYATRTPSGNFTAAVAG
ncbi:MAG: prolipoprotein diacylglyceryl transferase [Pseudomonadota bacterium]